MTWPIAFPKHLLRSTQYSPPRLIGAKITGGRSMSGIMQAARIDGGGLWTVRFASAPYDDLDDIRTLELLQAYLAEGARPIRVPVYGRADNTTQPWPTINGAIVTGYNVSGFSDDTYFSDGTGILQPAIVVNVGASAALRATTLPLQKIACGSLRGGEIFSLRHATVDDRLYRVVAVTAQSDSAATVTVEPPLRDAVEGGELLEFDAPRCVMQLSDDDGMSLIFDPPYRVECGVSFIESFLPLG